MTPFFINFAEFGGGAEQFSRELFEAFPQSTLLVKHKVSGNERVMTFAPDRFDIIVEYVDLFTRKFTRHSGIRNMLGYHDSFHRTYSKLTKVDSFNDCDVVHLNNIHGSFFDLNSLEKLDSLKPIVWSLHDMWAITGGEAYTFNHKGYLHGDWKTPFLSNYPLRKPMIDRRKKNLQRKKSLYDNLHNTVFVPVSDWLGNAVRTAYVTNPHTKIKVIKNGVDRDIFKPIINSNRSKPRLLYFHNQSPFKGAEFALSTLRKYQSSCDIVLIGKSLPDLQIYRHYDKKILDRREIAELYRSVDIILFPSTAENMPLTLLEAMSCGVVPVTFEVGGIPEIVRDGLTGSTASEINSKGLELALDRALNSDLNQLSRNGIDLINQNHNLSSVINDYKLLYAELLETQS